MGDDPRLDLPQELRERVDDRAVLMVEYDEAVDYAAGLKRLSLVRPNPR
jgi:hypothetical protein